MAASNFINFRDFVNRGAGLPFFLPASLLMSCALLALSGCAPHGPQQVEDTETSGRITVVSVPEVAGLVGREIQAFKGLYPRAAFGLKVASSRDAVRALLSQQADLAVLSRELEPEERSVMVKGGMELEGYRFARDAVCVVVHPGNPVEHIALDDLRRVYQGLATDWDDLGGHAGRIEPVVQAPESDIMATFVQRVLGGEQPSAPAWRAASDSAVVAHVRAVPGAVGFVSMAWDGHGAKTLQVSALTGLPYQLPDAERVYKGEYPVTRSCNLYVRSRGARLANGLVTFISALDGQRIVHEAGLVPTAVPVRFARRSPILGTH